MGVSHAEPAASGSEPGTAVADGPNGGDGKGDGKGGKGDGKGGKGGKGDGKKDNDGKGQGAGKKDGKDGAGKKDGKDGAGKKDGKGKDGKKDQPAEDPNIVKGTPCTKSADACVDIAAKKAWLVDGDGKVMRGPVPIGPGGPGYESPRGTFSVLWKNRDHRSVEFDNAPMPFAVFFAEGGVAFHEGDTNGNSHGCVRLTRPDAEAFFNFLEVDDEVQVH